MAARRCAQRSRDPKAAPAPDLVERQFDQQHLDALWIGDVTYIPTGEGFLYLSTVIDACSRRLLGWSMTDHLRTELCLDAVALALNTRPRKTLGWRTPGEAFDQLLLQSA